MKTSFLKIMKLGTLSILPIGMIASVSTISNNNYKSQASASSIIDTNSDYQTKAINSFKSLVKQASLNNWDPSTFSSRVLSMKFRVAFDIFNLENHVTQKVINSYTFKIGDDADNYFNTPKGISLLKNTKSSVKKTTTSLIKLNYFALISKYVGQNYPIKSTDVKSQMNFSKLLYQFLSSKDQRNLEAGTMTRVVGNGIIAYATNQITKNYILTPALANWNPTSTSKENAIINCEKTSSTPDLYGAKVKLFTNSSQNPAFALAMEYIHNFQNHNINLYDWIGFDK